LDGSTNSCVSAVAPSVILLAGRVKDGAAVSWETRAYLMATTLLLALGATTTLACCAAGLAACSSGGAGAPAVATSDALTPAPFFGGDPANHATFGVDVSFWETPLAQSQMDCFWASGVRHVIVGTQDEGITREQLAMAVSRGMTVDAYVYLYWSNGQSMAAQVDTAFSRVQGLPVGRMWLDIEQSPGSLGSETLDADIAQAVAECQARGTVTCGIYTGPGFWKSYVGDTTQFTGVPLWWAEYDGVTSLSSWSTEQFGGWIRPVGKQWATQPLCGVGGADWDTIQVTAAPTVVVDRSPPTDTGQVPPAPGGLWPTDGYPFEYGYAKIMSATIPLATSYQLQVERWSGSAWLTYYTWTNPDAFVQFDPAVANAMYHFRVRAENAHGWGPWSDWATFDFGTYTGPLPPSGGSTVDAGSVVDSGAEADTGAMHDAGAAPDTGAVVDGAGSSPTVPSDLTPNGDALMAPPDVTLGCSAVAGATGYQFAIELLRSGAWTTYYTYSTVGPTQTFYPAVSNASYRFDVRAEVGGVWGAWSPYATFQFQ
jgi:hypothetical protein